MEATHRTSTSHKSGTKMFEEKEVIGSHNYAHPPRCYQCVIIIHYCGGRGTHNNLQHSQHRHSARLSSSRNIISDNTVKHLYCGCCCCISRWVLPQCPPPPPTPQLPCASDIDRCPVYLVSTTAQTWAVNQP